MNKKLRLKLLLFFFFGISISAISQNTIHQDLKTLLKENADKAYKTLQLKNQPNLSANKFAKQNYFFQLNENDPYQGRKAEFLTQLIVKELPNDFPIYNKSYGVKGYNQIISVYYKSHINLLNEKLKYKLLPQ